MLVSGGRQKYRPSTICNLGLRQAGFYIQVVISDDTVSRTISQSGHRHYCPILSMSHHNYGHS
jgi:hypothetical protein